MGFLIAAITEHKRSKKSTDPFSVLPDNLIELDQLMLFEGNSLTTYAYYYDLSGNLVGEFRDTSPLFLKILNSLPFLYGLRSFFAREITFFDYNGVIQVIFKLRFGLRAKITVLDQEGIEIAQYQEPLPKTKSEKILKSLISAINVKQLDILNQYGEVRARLSLHDLMEMIVQDLDGNFIMKIKRYGLPLEVAEKFSWTDGTYIEFSKQLTEEQKLQLIVLPAVVHILYFYHYGSTHTPVNSEL